MQAAQQINPFQPQQAPHKVNNSDALVEVESQRAMKEVEAAMVIAKRFPRNQLEAMDKVIQACARPTLAEGALYAYPRGSQMVTGPSIRLAESIAQCWGNLQFGIRELSQANGESTVEAFAWDIESNTRQVKVFQVKHSRYSKAKGNAKLQDPRDIYEMVANQGARRLRACILGVIPGDVIDAAVKQCETTVHNSIGAPEEQIKSLVEAFEKIGVSRKQIIKRLGHNLDSVIAVEIMNFKKIYRSIKYGMASIEDFFEKETAADSLNKKLSGEEKQKTYADITEMMKAGKNKAERLKIVEEHAGHLPEEQQQELRDAA